MILGLHHAAIAVPDIEAALRFYGGVVCFEVVNEVTLPGGDSINEGEVERV